MKLQILTVLALAFASTTFAHTLDDYAKRLEMICESRTIQESECVCPYDVQAQECVGLSAYDKDRGDTPLCYPTDIDEAMLSLFRAGDRDMLDSTIFSDEHRKASKLLFKEFRFHHVQGFCAP